jgi:hypothetical protein
MNSQKQINVTCHVRETGVGTETISFSFNLGPIRIVCIANIPEEGKRSAPGYVKIQLPDANGEYPSKPNFKARRDAENAGTQPESDEASVAERSISEV